MAKVCAVEICDRDAVSRGWCKMHYKRWQKCGDTLADQPPIVRVRALLATSDTAPCSHCGQDFTEAQFAKNRSICRPCKSREDRRMHVASGHLCVDCGDPCTRTATRCKACGYAKRRKGERRVLTKQGYIQLLGAYEHPNASSFRGRMFEHVKVMSEIVGRPLLPGETVHHKNGVRDDNRPENLELWVTAQPRGQRPADLVEWAHEILRRYPNELAS